MRAPTTTLAPARQRAVAAAEAREERRFLHVGGVRVPLIEGARRHFEQPPGLGAFEGRGVFLAEQLGPQRRRGQGGHLVGRRPQVAQVHRPPVGPRAQRVVRQVDVDGPGEGERHHQRRRGQIVGPHQRVDARLEVAVAAQDRRHDQPVVLDGPGQVVGQRPAVADAGGAAVADRGEAEGFERLEQARVGQIAGDRPRARRQAGAHPAVWASDPAPPRSGPAARPPA